MNETELKEKLEQAKVEAKAWLGKTIDSQKEEVESILDKTAGKFIAQKADALKQYESAKEIFENRSEEVQSKIQLQWDKFSSQDVKEIGKSFEKLTLKLKKQ